MARQGYTLLELLLVLTLLGLLSVLVLPQIFTMVQSNQRADQRQDVLLQVAGLGYQCYKTGIGYQLGGKSSRLDHSGLLELPPGWRIESDTVIHYHANGICEGGRFTLHYPGGTEVYQLTPPLCVPRAVSG